MSESKVELTNLVESCGGNEKEVTDAVIAGRRIVRKMREERYATQAAKVAEYAIANNTNIADAAKCLNVGYNAIMRYVSTFLAKYKPELYAAYKAHIWKLYANSSALECSGGKW